MELFRGFSVGSDIEEDDRKIGSKSKVVEIISRARIGTLSICVLASSNDALSNRNKFFLQVSFCREAFLFLKNS